MESSRRSSYSSLNNSYKQQTSQRHWIERHFCKRECVCFIPNKDRIKCSCGRSHSRHANLNLQAEVSADEKWSVFKHTEVSPTDAFGTLEFQGGAHPLKAQYVRVASDTKPDLILQLLSSSTNWNLELPKLLISVHGGIANFDLQPKLKRVFRKGFLKAAATTSAWVITAGTNTGVMKHVGEAIGERSAKAKNNIVTIGIAPWGVVHNRDDLLGRDIVKPYHAISSPKSNFAVLNSYHSYFLLVDNGTVGKYGGEIQVRKQLEKYISQQKILSRNHGKAHVVPVVCVVLEGGTNTIRKVLEYVTDTPPVPVVVCDGSGRAADLLAFTHKYAQEDGTMLEGLKSQLVSTIEKTFQYCQEQAERLFIELMLCVKKKELITVFRLGEGGVQDIDLAILTALLKGQNLNAAEQLSLALSWNRVDIARSHIFVYGQEWPKKVLEQAMMDALVNDRVDFVRLLMENGVSMADFLTIQRLEELYNTKSGPSNTLRYLVRDVRKNMAHNYQYTLLDIGLVIDQLMGGAYRASYCRRKFRAIYNAIMKKPLPNTPLHYSHSQGHSIGNIVLDIPVGPQEIEQLTRNIFQYPFHDLMVWSVLMKRQKMALFMWQHGEEALSKALVASCLYKAMAKEAAEDDLEVDISENLKANSKEFAELAISLLDQCYEQDDDDTEQLLTYELKYWSNQTCLSLAVAGTNREFLAHTCCQILLTDMWMGGLRMRKNTSFKVILGILIPPTILALEFKSKEELQLMPQTVEEHIQEIETDSDSEDSSVCENKENEDFYESPDAHYPSRNPFNTTANGGLISDYSLVNDSIDSRRKDRPLKIDKKIYEFYAAPITKFWLHAMMYLAFVIVFSYVVLVKMKRGPNPNSAEVFVILYIVTLTIEKVREIIASEPVKISQKMSVHFREGWNLLDTTAILLFAIGMVFRLQHDFDVHMVGRCMYCVDIMFWYIRILDLFAVSKYLGPYVTIVGKMVIDMLNFLVIMLIVLMSFGVARQAILYPQEEPSWRLARDIFLEPYFMLYGEVYAGTIDRCQGEDQSGCTPGSWITPITMSIYLLVANILLINLLIAVFNSTFQKVSSISKQLWKFQRYSLILEYEQKPLLPPPLILINHVYLIIKYLYRKCKGKMNLYDTGLKVFLSEVDVEKLHDFEEGCVEELFRYKENERQSRTDERIRITTERIENMGMRMEDMHQKENQIKLSLQSVDYRLAKLEELAVHTASALTGIQEFMTEQLGHIQTPRQEPAIKGKDVQDVGFYGDDISFPDPLLSNFATPMVRHSEDPLKEEELKHLTSYANTDKKLEDNTDAPGPKTSKSDVADLESSFHSIKTDETTPTVVQGGFAYNQNASNFDDKDISTSSQESSDVSGKRESLLRRRLSSKLLPPLSVGGKEDLLERRVSFQSPVKTELTCITMEPAQYTSAHLQDDTQMCTVEKGAGKERIVTVGGKQASQRERARSVSGELFLRSASVPSSSTTSAILPLVSASLSANLNAGNVTAPLTVGIGEYTTITDNIDTSCVMPQSPGSSPTTPHSKFFPEDRFGSPERKALMNEERVLKNAEETEKQQMENVIRHRLRQISIDEGDNLSDIARLAINELETMDVHSICSEMSYETDLGNVSDCGIVINYINENETDTSTSKEVEELKAIAQSAEHENVPLVTQESQIESTMVKRSVPHESESTQHLETTC